jgi:phosphoserine phosphatase RsbX
MFAADLKRDETIGVASINRPFLGERVSGDLPFWKEQGEELLVGVADGIGHGPRAHGAVQTLLKALEGTLAEDPVALLKVLDKAIRPSPGLAISLGWLNRSSGSFRFSGVGNVFACTVTKEGLKRLVSCDGMLGQNLRSPMLQEMDLSPGDRVIMASDGIKERFYTQAQERRLRYPLGEVCWYLADEFGKTHDDTSCLIVEMPE